MLTIQIPAKEFYDERTSEFFTLGPYTLQLEHSLRSIAKWEGRTHKRFFDAENENGMKPVDFVEYVRCMTVNQVRDERVYAMLQKKHYEQIAAYMGESQTARKTKKNSKNGKKGKKPRTVQEITVETIYFLMIRNGIPFECENWHYSRLSALIEACEANGAAAGGKMMSYREQQQFFNELNNQRRAKYGTKG